MEKFIVLGLLACAFAFADRDTIPLNKRTSPSKTNSGGDATSLLKNPQRTGLQPTGPQAAQKAAEAAMPKPYVAGLDTYGSKRINDTILKQALGKDLDTWIAKGLSGDPSSPDLEAKLTKTIQQRYGFASAEWSVIQFFEPGDLAVYLTLDVVEKDDVAKRMPFLPEPTQELKDPDNLIKTWMEYEDTALELVESANLEPESEECVAFHCPFGHKHARLKRFQPIFVDGVAKNEKALAEILSKDKRPEHRAAAAFLLAYLKDGKKVVSYMVDRIKDPAAYVRNNAMRVLGDVAEFHSEFLIPIKPLVEALNFPRVSDRAKASYVVHILALNSQAARDEILKSAVPNLLSLLGQKQPDQRELAHSTLRKVSGKEFPIADLASWQSWYNKVAKERGVAVTKP